MRKRMRMVLTSVTALGLAMFAMALTGINSLASDLERAAPPRAVPAPATEEFQSREIDCPLKRPDRPRI